MSEELLSTKEHTEAHGDKIKGYRKLDMAAVRSVAKPAGF